MRTRRRFTAESWGHPLRQPASAQSHLPLLPGKRQADGTGATDGGQAMIGIVVHSTAAVSLDGRGARFGRPPSRRPPSSAPQRRSGCHRGPYV